MTRRWRTAMYSKVDKIVTRRAEVALIVSSELGSKLLSCQTMGQRYLESRKVVDRSKLGWHYTVD